MSQILKGIFGALAISLTFGAVQFASGHDLTGGRKVAPAAPETDVNRAAKADRASMPALPMQTQTIALRLDGLADTSVLVRVPAAKEAKTETRNRPAPPPATKSGVRKT